MPAFAADPRRPARVLARGQLRQGARPTSSTVFFIGLTNGAVYALVALGYTLVYGILELINFAHGDVFMLGGMISATIHLVRVPPRDDASIGVLLPAILVVAARGDGHLRLLNATIEFIAYRPLRNAPRLAPLITAIGMSFILQDVALAWKGPEYVSLPHDPPAGEVFTSAASSTRGTS